MVMQIKIGRWNGEGQTSRETWKELISSLALAGYEVYADEEYIVFNLGDDDEANKITKEVK